MPIQYPRDTEALYNVFRISTGEVLYYNRPYYKADGSAPDEGDDPDIVYLQIIKQAEPDYDPRYYILNPVSTPDIENGNWNVTYQTIKRPIEEINLAAENVELQAMESLLPYSQQAKLIILGLAVLFRMTENQTLTAKEQVIKSKVIALGVRVWKNDATLKTKLAALAENIEIDLDSDYERDPD